MLIAHLDSDLTVHARPGGGRRIGVLAARTPNLRTPSSVWVERISRDGRWGRVRVSFQPGAATGWIELSRVRTRSTNLRVEVSLADRTLAVRRGARLLARIPVGIGAGSSPTPTGRYVVSDLLRSTTSAQRRAYGSFAFGLSGIQPRPPAGWSGPAQLAIHGTGTPGSIGRASSAGCVRISERGLRLLRPLLEVGTPVVIRRS
jgi:lipoprotein-anchoring transpeptidase ErfK/SrfK